MATTFLGPFWWRSTRGRDGFVDYKIKFRVRSNDPNDGPAVVRATSGLPVPGQHWEWMGDIDLKAVCTYEDDIVPQLDEQQGNLLYVVECNYTSRPLPNCQEDYVLEDPLLAPPQISVSYSRTKVEATVDNNGFPLLNSAFEPLRGPPVEFDENILVVRVRQNIPDFDFELHNRLLDNVNEDDMWGFATGTVKLSEISADRKFKADCEAYWERELRFEVKGTYWYRDVPDYGSKAIRGRWVTNRTTGVQTYQIDTVNGEVADYRDPKNFRQFKGPTGENEHVYLNGKGMPAGVIVSVAGTLMSAIDNNTDSPLTSPDSWVPLTNGVDPVTYTNDLRIKRGALVTTSDGGIFLAVEAEPPLPPLVDGNVTEGWVEITLVRNENEYSSATTYQKGDYVTGFADETTSETIRVDVYRYSDLFELDLPADLNNP